MSDVLESRKCRNGELVICSTQDVEPYLDDNKRALNDFQRRRNETMRKVASIPVNVAYQWLKEGINVWNKEDHPKIQRMLNSPEYAYLRTSPGKIRMKA